MAWNNSVVTADGVELLKGVLSGGQFNVTSAAGGTGTVESLALRSRKTLVEQKQTLSVVSIDNTSEGKRIKVQINNVSLDTGYRLNQIGVWATIDGGAPVLFAIMQDTDGMEIPSKAELANFVFEISMVVKFSNDSTFTANVDLTSMVSLSTLNEAIATHNGSSSAHADLMVASKHTYDNATSKLSSNNVQGAIDEISEKTAELTDLIEAVPLSYSPMDHNHDLLYASKNHNHDLDYASKSHTHPYADNDHDHDGDYAPVHNHPYASNIHNHDEEYSPSNHTHPYAADNHNHSGVYSPVHSHPYATDNHNHSGVYAPVHSHPYSLSTHKHDGVYAPVHSHPYASSSHNHSGIYEPVITKNTGFNLNKSDSVTSTSTTYLATSKAAKTAYDRGTSAINSINSHAGTGNIHTKITFGIGEPSGGVDGDVYLKY